MLYLPISSLHDYHLPHNTLVLCDTGDYPTPPALLLRPIDSDAATSYFVYACSPRTSRFREWSKQKQAAIFTMKLWKRQEIADLMCVFFGPLVMSRWC